MKWPPLAAFRWTAPLSYGLFILALFWEPLTHPDEVPGFPFYDANYAFTYKYAWIESLKKLDPAFWDPYSSLGQPFLAMASPGAYAPFNFLFFLFPIAYGFTLCYVLHFLLSAMGTYFFLRNLGCGGTGSFLGGLAFAFSGFFMGHLFAGHNSIVWAASWIPLVLLGLKVFTDEGRKGGLLLASASMGFCILEGMPQINMYAMMAAFFFLAWAWITGKIHWKGLLGGGAAFLLLSFSLGLCQLAPTFQFARLSDRWAWGWSSLMKEYFSPADFRLLVDPFFKGGPDSFIGKWGYHELVIYVGLVPLFLALTGFLPLALKKPTALWLGLLAGLSTVLAMGDSTVITHQIYLFFCNFLPGFSHNRSVSRILVLAAFALACLAGMALDGWIQFWKNRVLAPAARFFLVYGIPAFLLAGTSLDLYRFGIRHMDHCSAGKILSEDMFKPETVKKIMADPNYPRVQTAVIGQKGILHRTSTTMTVYTLKILPTTVYLNLLWNDSDSPLSDLIRLTYQFQSEDAIPNQRWKRIPGIGEPVYTNVRAFPRAFMVGGYEVNTEPVGFFHFKVVDDIRTGRVDPRREVVLAEEPEGKPDWPKGWVGAAKITRYDYNDVEIKCSNGRPCFLFLSDSYFPGWKAWVDGKEESIYQADAAFRAVELKAPGSHLVKMAYYPPVIVYTFFYSLFCWIVLGIGWFFRGRLSLWYSARLSIR